MPEDNQPKNTEKRNEDQSRSFNPARRTFSPRSPQSRPQGRFGTRPNQNPRASFGTRPQSGDARSSGFSNQGGSFRPSNRDNRFIKKRKADFSEDPDIFSKVVLVRRVTRVVKGGKRMRFSALVVVGDKKGKFGVGLKKGNDYADAVNKATAQAKKGIQFLHLDENGSIPFPTTVKFKAAKVFLKPAKSGTGLIAGGPIRSILELAGVKNIYSKIIGSNNKVTNIVAVQKALVEFGLKNVKNKTL
jgi:small subunit ribosomal protein S5